MNDSQIIIEMNKNKFFGSLLCGVIGGIVVISLFILYLNISKSYNYKSVYIINPQVQTDSLKLIEIQTLNKLKVEGLLVTPDEFANNITSYYNTFVTFLSVLFVVFSFISYLSIKATTKENIKKDIDSSLKEMLNDSVKVKETIIGTIYGKFDEGFVDKEDFTATVASIESKIDLLFENNRNVQQELE